MTKINDNKQMEVIGLRKVVDHIYSVQQQMANAISHLLARSAHHDQSKYSPSELGLVLGKPKLDTLEYMSNAERSHLDTVKDALTHHYDYNSHHPEHYKNGIDGMGLLDLLEMACDWKAASEASPNGSFLRSIEYNKDRFNMSPQLVSIFENTAKELGWIDD